MSSLIAHTVFNALARYLDRLPHRTDPQLNIWEADNRGDCFDLTHREGSTKVATIARAVCFLTADLYKEKRNRHPEHYGILDACARLGIHYEQGLPLFAPDFLEEPELSHIAAEDLPAPVAAVAVRRFHRHLNLFGSESMPDPSYLWGFLEQYESLAEYVEVREANRYNCRPPRVCEVLGIDAPLSAYRLRSE